MNERLVIQPHRHADRTPTIPTFGEYQRLYRLSLDAPDHFWAQRAEQLTWFHRWHTVFDSDYEETDMGWFLGGRLNACYNCVDRHLNQRGDQTAVIWAQDEPGQYQRITYRQLKHHVARGANVLLEHGVRKGDRVIVYLPMIPELIYTMLACARIGAVHSVVFGGFSSEAIRDRILDCGARLVVTANEGLRGGRRLPLKETVDRAVDGLDQVATVLVARRTDLEPPMRPGRDWWLDEECHKQRSTCSIEWMGAEDPLFILYTSGSTGKPKGVLHTTGGYLVFASYSHQVVFDYRDGDIYFCAADCGWITGHSYIVYGPLANGATTVLFESTPVFPDAGRYWQIVDDLQVNIFYTAPTAIRALVRAGDEYLARSSRESLRTLGTVGEPINPDTWLWYYDKVGRGRCNVVDTWWQTETGGILIAPLPGVTPMKPGSATLPFFGVRPLLVDDDGRELDGPAAGNLCLRHSWPGQARTIHGAHHRFHETYFSRFPGLYFTGDGCRRDEDGYYWITGRVDDVINVAGHRLGTAEIESALVAHEAVTEAAVVGFPHEIKGQGIFAYVILDRHYEAIDAHELQGLLKEQVRHVIGPIATPDAILVAPGLPKTRSGKIMRRILRQIAAGEYRDLGDVTTLAEPDVVERLVESHRTLSAAARQD
ncbi:MAG: acetate--CoA ligase [Candidatus Krumholzibacteria bacterium]|jgi:acetyl-CoA synthetase|nr:acetate--CoA ligase [Candidatus Krumholzibacteria bacterium]